MSDADATAAAAFAVELESLDIDIDVNKAAATEQVVEEVTEAVFEWLSKQNLGLGM